MSSRLWRITLFILCFLPSFRLPFLAAQSLTGQAAQSEADALAEYRAGRYQRAVDICKSEIERKPSDLEAHVVICWALIKLERYDEALSYAETGRRLNRNDVRIIEVLGEICYFKGQNSESLKHFENYIRLAPDGARIDAAYYYLGEIYIRQGRFRYADISISTALHYVPLNAAWWGRLGYAREQARDYSEALKAYEQALGLDAQLTDVRRGLERVRAALSR